MENLLYKTNGNLTIVEMELGIPSGLWKNKELIRIDISNPKELNLRMSSRNEIGADELLWVPGGKTIKGIPEAIIDPVIKNGRSVYKINVIVQ